MKPTKNDNLKALLVVGVIVGTLVWALFSAETSETERVLILIIIAALCLGTLYVGLNIYLGNSLGRAMRASSPREDVASLSAEQEVVKRRSPPTKAFAYQVFDKDSTIELSPPTEDLLKRGHKHFRHFVSNLAIGALVLCFSIPVVSAFDAVIDGIASNILCCSGITLLAALFIANPRRYPTMWTVVVWGGLNLLLIAFIAFVILSVAFQTTTLEPRSLLLFLPVAGLLAAYGVLFALLGRRLRNQVAAHKPLQLLALWVFDSSNNLVSTMGGIGTIWQFLGTTHYLRGGEFTVDMGALTRKKRSDLVVDTPEELAKELHAFNYFPTWWGAYSTNTLLCGDAVWKYAVHALLRNADVVVMGLFEFSPSNQGCLYELGLLLDRFPMHRVLFLIDDTTDLNFLLETLRKNWDTVAEDSPNHNGNHGPIRIYRLGARFDNPTEGDIKYRYRPSQVSLLTLPRIAKDVQSGTARETNKMLKLILEGASPQA